MQFCAWCAKSVTAIGKENFMIELKNNSLKFSFPDTHEDAQLSISFQRTFRIPDDGTDYPLPPGFGQFSLEHVDDHAKTVPSEWVKRGGVMMPMFQSEAMWINFSSKNFNGYPFAVKIAAGKINAVTGDSWDNGLRVRPAQDYLPIPEQPWLDGFSLGKGLIRQFTAMPLGSGYSAEEQITGKAEFGGLQVIAFPMKAERYQELQKEKDFGPIQYMCLKNSVADQGDAMSMGLAPGGKMRQEIFEDEFDPSDYDLNAGSRCFIHLCNSLTWRQITGQNPPQAPYTAKEYAESGLPWFDYYAADAVALEGSDKLAEMKSVAEMAQNKGENVLPENESVTPHDVVKLRKGLAKWQVREGRW